MKLSIDISDPLNKQLASTANRLNVNQDILVKAALTDLLEKSQEDIEAAIKRVIGKNKELSKRLNEEISFFS